MGCGFKKLEKGDEKTSERGGELATSWSKIPQTFFQCAKNFSGGGGGGGGGEVKTVKKAIFGHFLKNFDKKIAFFWRALPLKVSIYWRQRRL